MKDRFASKNLNQLFATTAVAAASLGIVQAARAQNMVYQETALTTTSVIAKDTSSSLPTVDELPNAPSPQGAVDEEDQQATQQSQTNINAIPLLPPKLVSGTTLTAHDKWEIYYHRTYSPAAVIYPLFGAGIKMANPKKDYPREWQDGMGAFGRNYGNEIAQRTSRSTADFATQVLFHEDPRYKRSESKNPVLRIGHALAWTVVDKSDSGHRMFALSTFTSSAAGGFVGMAYLPDGYNDVTHAEQRMAMGIEGRAISNILTEFQPLWGPVAAKLRVPKLLPEWWGPKPKR